MFMVKQLEILEAPNQLLKVLTYTFEAMIESNANQTQGKSIFDTRRNSITSLSLPAFIKRIFEYMNCSKSCFIHSLILLDRIRTKDPRYKISRSNAHKLIFTAILISVKALDDHFFTQKHYSLVSGLNLKQLNKLEIHFLNAIDFKTYVSPKTFCDYTQKIDEAGDDQRDKYNKGGQNEDGSNTSQSQSFEEKGNIQKNNR